MPAQEKKAMTEKNLKSKKVLMSLPTSSTRIPFLAVREVSESTQELLLMCRLLQFIFWELRNAYSSRHSLGENSWELK